MITSHLVEGPSMVYLYIYIYRDLESRYLSSPVYSQIHTTSHSMSFGISSPFVELDVGLTDHLRQVSDDIATQLAEFGSDLGLVVPWASPARETGDWAGRTARKNSPTCTLGVKNKKTPTSETLWNIGVTPAIVVKVWFSSTNHKHSSCQLHKISCF